MSLHLQTKDSYLSEEPANIIKRPKLCGLLFHKFFCWNFQNEFKGFFYIRENILTSPANLLKISIDKERISFCRLFAKNQNISKKV